MPKASPESPEKAPKHAKQSLLILHNRTSNFGLASSEMLLNGSRPAHEGVDDTSNDWKGICAAQLGTLRLGACCHSDRTARVFCPRRIALEVGLWHRNAHRTASISATPVPHYVGTGSFQSRVSYIAYHQDESTWGVHTGAEIAPLKILWSEKQAQDHASFNGVG